jgi:iron complex outermembrane recepter protein
MIHAAQPTIMSIVRMLRIFLCLPLLLRAQTSAPTHQQINASAFSKMSLEELVEIHVTSVSRREERATNAAAAISVITQEDIRRSGSRSIADALKLVHGLDVARISGNSWSVGTRGFSVSSPNKMQVLIDGRNVYSPLFAGTFWDTQGLMLEDVDRIEVIRGPGGTLWGSNAVNGVVNIVTRPARATQGGLAVASGGTDGEGGGLRYGGSMGDRGYYRIYANYDHFGALDLSNGASAEDPLRRGFMGFRTDWTLPNSDSLTVQHDFYRGNSARRRQDDVNTRGGNVLVRWAHRFGNGSDLQIQSYYDRTSRDLPPTFFEVRNTYDIDMQQNTSIGERNNLVWGLGYRASSDDTRKASILFFEPEDRTLNWFSFFGQDEIALLSNSVHLILGSKFERNSYTGLELQPTVRLSWHQSTNKLFWGALSRAVRVPTRIDTDLIIQVPGISITGNPSQESEELVAYEFGYKYAALENITFNLSGYYNQYDHIRSIERPLNSGDSLRFGNTLMGHTYGSEVEANVQVLPWWQVRSTYSFLQLHLERVRASRAVGDGSSEANDPKHRFSLRSSMNFPKHVELDFWIRGFTERPIAASTMVNPVPGYAAFDVRLGWRPVSTLELSVVGHDLPQVRHAEFPGTPQEEIPRGLYGKAIWSF